MTLERMLKVARAVALPLVFATVSGCGITNPEVPAGYEGYNVNRPFLFGQAEYEGSLVGPTSTGLTWRNFVDVLDMQTKTYTEEFKILTKDNLNITFRAHTKIHLKPGEVKPMFEEYGGGNWYERVVREPFRTAVREAVRPNNAFDVKSLSSEIGSEVYAQMVSSYAKTPIVFETVNIGNIDYPGPVEDSIVKKLATQQDLERKDKELEIAKKNADIRVADANGIARAQKIIDRTLTQAYLQHEAIETYGKLAESNNTTFVILPTNPNSAGMPLILGGK